MRVVGSAVVVIAFVVAACGNTSTPPSELANGTNEGGAPDPSTVSQPIPSSSSPGVVVKINGTVPVAPGVQVGYALTATGPMTYQLRWTGDAKVAGDGFQHFYGAVWTTGKFTAVTPGCSNQVCPLESGDYVSSVTPVQGGQRIDWNTYASTGWDGFGFSTDTEPIYLSTWVDGVTRSDLVYYSSTPNGAATNPPAIPFAASSAP
jgi:hypothetical protein